MANTQEITWKEGDEFYFTESPFPKPLTETQMQTKFVLEKQNEYREDWFEVKWEKILVTVATSWIRKPETDA